MVNGALRIGVRTNLDRAEVHGMLDDVVVVVQLQGLGVHRLVEGPGVGRVLLGQHLFQDAVAVFHVLRQLAFLAGVLRDLAFLQILLWGLDGPPRALSPVCHFGLLRIGDRDGRLAAAGGYGGCGGGGRVRFPFYTFFLVKEEAGDCAGTSKKKRNPWVRPT